MTKKITVSLPDEVADQLDGLPNVSAFVADSLRERLARIEGDRVLAAAGFVFTEEGLAAARAELRAVLPEVTDDLRQRAEDLRAVVQGIRR